MNAEELGITQNESELAEETSALEKENVDTPPTEDNFESASAEEEVDYEALVRSDMAQLSEQFSDGDEIRLSDLKNPMRYGALRDLGLTPGEAYLASGGKKERVDNRAHLSSSVPKISSRSFSEIPRSQLEAVRHIFSDMSEREIRNLYRKVTQ